MRTSEEKDKMRYSKERVSRQNSPRMSEVGRDTNEKHYQSIMLDNSILGDD